MENILNTTSYEVTSGVKYYLTILFGNGQDGNSTFKDVNGSYHNGAVINTVIGTGSLMKNQSILIGSIVTDTNPKTNWTSITYFINGEKLEAYKAEVEKENSAIYYTTTINFI